MTGWREAPARLELEDGVVHLWRVVLRGDDAWARRHLSADERARAEAFRFDRDRRQFTLTRGTLRALLGRYLGLHPAALAFERGPEGKPSLAGGGGGLRFNVSHSGELALVAIAHDIEVGADVEEHRPALDVEALLARIATTAEQRALRAVAPGARLEAFYGLWTRKEAVVKAQGSGLSLPLQQVELPVPAGPGPCRVALTADGGTPAVYEVRAVDAGPGLSAAVAHGVGGARVALYHAHVTG